MPQIELKTPDASPDEAGWFDRSSRPRLVIAGPDRAKFLHNLTTNDVKRLAVGSGHESFVTTPQGKVLAYVTLLALEDDSILLRTDPESLEVLLPHLRKYGVFDDVTIDEVSSRTFEYHVIGRPSPGLEGVEMPPEAELGHRATRLAGLDVRVIRESVAGPSGITVIGKIEDAPAIVEALGPGELGGEVFEALRIEAGTPISGRDVTANHLPQEVGRDSRAINFVKGCYLGQETVARLDALGHVNKIFRGLQFEGTEIPPVGTPLKAEGKEVGVVTSSAFSSRWGAPLALGYLRVAVAGEGTRVSWSTAEGINVGAVVHELPMRRAT